MSSKSEKPKSNSLVSKMKKLVKSRSIEESQTAQAVLRMGVEAAGVGATVAPAQQPTASAGSNSSLTSDLDKDPGKVRLKDKVKGIFRRTSRSPSAERTKSAGLTPPEPPRRSRESTPKKDSDQPSLQRPLIAAEPGSKQRPLQPAKQP